VDKSVGDGGNLGGTRAIVVTPVDHGGQQTRRNKAREQHARRLPTIHSPYYYDNEEFKHQEL
jgi:hypothetical protein